MWYAQLDVVCISHVFIRELIFTRVFVCCCCNLMMFMTGVNVWWVYLCHKNIPRAIVLMLGNKVVLNYYKSKIAVFRSFIYRFLLLLKLRLAFSKRIAELAVENKVMCPSSSVARCGFFGVRHETFAITKEAALDAVVGFRPAVTFHGVLYIWSH